ncbi:MAG: UTP--glucose-1-phosphate uridylyltransferase [Acidobacteria bacterium]|nr:MAG: UTP--glucose-1-phosphate uridylyltransferase [Acidobacteriota bacterium]
MRAAGLPELAIKIFQRHYERLLSGERGFIPEQEIRPVSELPDAEALGDAEADAGREVLPRTVTIKLNGGLGTSMGLERAKSLLRVKGELTFLDIIARQALSAGYALLLMNSPHTRGDSLESLARYRGLVRHGLPLDFQQHVVPKVAVDDLSPVRWPSDPRLEWCPPGHGDIYAALQTSGVLEKLLAAGIEYACVSNADNLGATIDPAILGYFRNSGLTMLLEAADRTESDQKGGHLAVGRDGRLLLREIAQCPPEDLPHHRDHRRHRFFGTNTIWLHLPSLRDELASRGGVLELPLICNRKTVDPRDPSSTPVYQLETAMGTAISVFRKTGAIRVPRSRFAPVKTTNDLLGVRSDAYELTCDFRVVLAPTRDAPPFIDLDPAHYKMIDQLESRFPCGEPSLIECERLRVLGDVRFGRGVRLRGSVTIRAEGGAPGFVPDGALIEGDYVCAV